MKNFDNEVTKKDMDKYSDYESYQFLRSEQNQFGDITVMRHLQHNHCVFMKEMIIGRKDELREQIIK